MDKRDVVVVGGGAAGFEAAYRVSQLGGSVVLVEKEKVGGVCVNWGCIPMCFMEHCVELIKSTKEAEKYGITVGKVSIDFAKLMGEKEKVVKGIVTGMETKLQAASVEVVNGLAKLASLARTQ